MTNVYSKAYTEVLEILSHFSKEEYSKIPEEKINFYRENMDKEYYFEINPNIDLSQQNISKEANAILIAIFMDYFANENQKKTLNNLLKQNEELLEEQKREKYNPDSIFKKEKQFEYEENKEVSLVEYKESILKRIINKIKDFFNIKL